MVAEHWDQRALGHPDQPAEVDKVIIVLRMTALTSGPTGVWTFKRVFLVGMLIDHSDNGGHKASVPRRRPARSRQSLTIIRRTFGIRELLFGQLTELARQSLPLLDHVNVIK